MAVRPEFRWWILTLVVVGVLVGISALALDRPNVVWEQGKAFCPHCRTAVPDFGSRCPTCREQYDWTVAPDDESPRSPWSLSALEAEEVRELVKGLGRMHAANRAAHVLGVDVEAAGEYLDHLGRGRCGWCGGTGRDLEAGAADGALCPACLGAGRCVACGGDRRMTVGDEGAHRASRAYHTGIADLKRSALSEEVEAKEVRRLAGLFLAAHAGSREAEGIAFWKHWGKPALPSTIVRACRARLDRLVAALRQE